MNGKRILILVALMAAVAGPLAGKALARPDKGGEAQGRCDQRGEHRLDRMAVLLDLSAAQRAEAETLLSAEREGMKALQDQARAGREALQQAALVVPFDEAKVRQLAAAQAKLQTEMMVARARQQNRLHALLTPEQQTKAAALKQKLGEGRGKHHHGF
jgi:protein CpxP